MVKGAQKEKRARLVQVVTKVPEETLATLRRQATELSTAYGFRVSVSALAARAIEEHVRKLPRRGKGDLS